jgi:flagellin
MIVRIQTLAIQGSSANNTAEATKLDAERLKLEGQIDKIANGTNYNGVNLLNGVNSASAAIAGTAATLAGATLSTAAASVVGLVSSGAPTFVEAATFTITQSTTGLITSITSDVALTSAATGAAIGGAAGSNLITAQTAVGAITVGGMIFTSAAAASGTPAAPLVTSTAAATAGTAGVAAGASAYTAALNFQVGDVNNANHQVGINLQNSYTTTSLGLSGVAGNLLTAAGSATYITTAIAAIDTLTNQRADLGATQNQLQFVNANLATAIEQVSSAVSSIRDADMAAEMTNFTKSQILVQAGTSMLAQANQASQNVLSLFR